MPLDDGVTNAELEEILFPGKYKSGSQYVEPDCLYIHRELVKPGVTMALLRGSTAESAMRQGKLQNIPPGGLKSIFYSVTLTLEKLQKNLLATILCRCIAKRSLQLKSQNK